MSKAILVLLLLSTAMGVNSQTLYTKTFGDSKGQPLIYLHGGPGYNCVSFEATTAQKLADEGFFVVVYDRRGEGRSLDKQAKFTFQQTFDDLNGLYKKLGLKKATLIGHSFGGIVATLYARQYPKNVRGIVLTGAPISLQETFKTILKTTKSIYQTKKDSFNLNYITILEKMDTASLEYSTYCFAHAMQNRFYSPKQPTEAAKNIYAQFRTDTLLMKYASQMTVQPPQDFWKNEHYTTLDLTLDLKKLKAKKMKIYGLYGKDDGLYAPEQVVALQSLIGNENLKYFDHCSHNAFIDQQAQFIEALKTWIK
ncbi:MAG: alpha/beta fold hydrolase [Saprospiraceae bacterium]